MKKFEYKFFDVLSMIAIRRKQPLFQFKAGEDIMTDILNELGQEGWDLFPQQHGYFGKKEIKA